MLKILAALGLSLTLSNPAHAAPASETVSFRVQASIGRCVPKDGVNPEKGLVCQNDRADTDADVSLTLGNCGEKNIFGPNCQGVWEETITVDQQTYRFRVIVGHFEKAPFGYQVSANICQEPVGLGECSFNTLYLPTAELPSAHLVAPWVKTGSGASAVWYNPQLLINRTAFPKR